MDTVAFSEIETADIISPDQCPFIEPGVQDQETCYFPSRFYTLRQVLRFGLTALDEQFLICFQ